MTSPVCPICADAYGAQLEQLVKTQRESIAALSQSLVQLRTQLDDVVAVKAAAVGEVARLSRQLDEANRALKQQSGRR